MTEKITKQVQLWRALFAGKKVRLWCWETGRYAHVVDGQLVDEKGEEVEIETGDAEAYEIYEEPARPVKWYCPRVVWFKKDSRPRRMGYMFYFQDKTPTNWFEKGMEFEILEWDEVEVMTPEDG